MLVVDDALLLAVLAETRPEDLQAGLEQGEPLTTGSWYWRLAELYTTRPSGGPNARALPPGRSWTVSTERAQQS
jgi:hypothetical protein